MLRITITAACAAFLVVGCGSSSKPQTPSNKAAAGDEDEKDSDDNERENDGGDAAGQLSGANANGAIGTDTATGTAAGVTVADGGTVSSTGTGVATNVDQAVGPAARLALNGVRLDEPDEAYQIEFTRVGGTASAIALPGAGGSSGIDAQCNDGGETHFTVAVLGDGRRYAPGVDGCFVAVNDGTTAVHLAFEEDCLGASWRTVDDTIVKLQCPNSRVVIDGVTLESGVPMADWLD